MVEGPGKPKPIKREINDEKESDTPRKKPKKMFGKITIDLTEDEPEAIVLDWGELFTLFKSISYSYMACATRSIWQIGNLVAGFSLSSENEYGGTFI